MQNIAVTADGSHTVRSEQFNECYHSERGAVMESRHVFIDAGFRQVERAQIAVLEVGFGTGLNALLTMLEAEKSGQHVYYESIDPYPLDLSTAEMLNFSAFLGIDKQLFMELHRHEWNTPFAVTPRFTLHKIKKNLLNYSLQGKFDVVYFDAFSPEAQPELWTNEVFSRIYSSLNNNSLLTTYSSKGTAKRNLREAGFTVQRLPGAGGKRHMLRAVKL
ncbi:MAG: tRNA (5-methylaminomethyl-2-thiouridine)(34)-methyltransferase MnmD [Prevotellaceae bacterium]|jgi:tRNA U34 5-methylaminomethyl-2-thiouridine-forming methyltransferase MnmC|nr:tRNA (5-methylaminomethyl-2-thiouridine)(34)-methyltransferase MnmD [Prevotellaceae bacterium]